MVEQHIDFPKVPEPFTLPPDEGQQIHDRMTEFFLEVIDFIGYGPRARAIYAEIESYDLCIPQPGRFRTLQTDGRLTVLRARSYPATSWLEIRSDTNMVQVAAACYLTKELVEQMREGLPEGWSKL